MNIFALNRVNCAWACPVERSHHSLAEWVCTVYTRDCPEHLSSSREHKHFPNSSQLDSNTHVYSNEFVCPTRCCGGPEDTYPDTEICKERNRAALLSD